jgi:hypothetical protein
MHAHHRAWWHLGWLLGRGERDVAIWTLGPFPLTPTSHFNEPISLPHAFSFLSFHQSSPLVVDAQQRKFTIENEWKAIKAG